jgi:hypothetical protein
MADNFYQIKQRVAELYALDPSNIQLIGSDKVRLCSFFVTQSLETRIVGYGHCI